MHEQPRPKESGDASPFDDLVALAQEAVSAAPAVKKEAANEMEALALKELEAREQDAVQTGRFEYLASTGNWRQLDKEKAPGIFDPRYRYSQTYIHTGPNTTWDLERTIKTPQDVLEALGQTAAFAEEQIQKGSEPVNLDTFYREEADVMIFTVREDQEANLKRKRFISPRVVAVRDLPKELAWKLYAQNVSGPTTGRAHWQELKEGIIKNLEGFTATAMEQGDLETALEGYKRLDKLQDPEVIGKIRGAMEKLRASKKPEDQEKLRRASRQILRLQ